jgi:glutamate dehydrogenase (NADP+)
VNHHCGQVGKGLLWGGAPVYQQAQGYGVVHFAQRMLADKGISLEGKKCLVTGSHSTALAVAEKLIEFGAIPITFTDSSGHIYEPGGFDSAKLKTIQRIKNERGARVGRYIIASTSAKFNEFESVFNIPCDLAFPCSTNMQLSAANVQTLADNGCMAIIEGVQQAMSNGAIQNSKKRGILHGPYRATTVGASLVNGMSIALNPLADGETLDDRVKKGIHGVFDEIKSTANEFNTRGDLHAGANIAAFLRVANCMLAHGST